MVFVNFTRNPPLYYLLSQSTSFSLIFPFPMARRHCSQTMSKWTIYKLPSYYGEIDDWNWRMWFGTGEFFRSYCSVCNGQVSLWLPDWLHHLLVIDDWQLLMNNAVSRIMEVEWLTWLAWMVAVTGESGVNWGHWPSLTCMVDFRLEKMLCSAIEQYLLITVFMFLNTYVDFRNFDVHMRATGPNCRCPLGKRYIFP